MKHNRSTASEADAKAWHRHTRSTAPIWTLGCLAVILLVNCANPILYHHVSLWDYFKPSGVPSREYADFLYPSGCAWQRLKSALGHTAALCCTV